MNITDYIIEKNELAIKNDIRSSECFLPRGFIVCCYCNKDKVLLLEANGRGGTIPHEFKKGISFPCVIRNNKNDETKKSLLSSLLKLFKR